MTTRTIFSSIAVLVLLGAVTACDSNLEASSTSTTAPSTSTERTTTTSEITSTTEDSGSTDSGSTGSDTSTTDGSSTTDNTLPGGITIPDDLTIPDDVKKEIDDALSEVGDCTSLAVSYGTMVSAAIASVDSVDFEKIRTDLKAAAPDDVDGAIDTVVDGYTELRSKGIIEGSDILSTPTFEDASNKVNDWISNSCGG